MIPETATNPQKTMMSCDDDDDLANAVAPLRFSCSEEAHQDASPQIIPLGLVELESLIESVLAASIGGIVAGLWCIVLAIVGRGLLRWLIRVLNVLWRLVVVALRSHWAGLVKVQTRETFNSALAIQARCGRIDAALGSVVST